MPGFRQLPNSRFPKYPLILDEAATKLPDRMRFEIKLGGEVIGFSELEGGDPPMGVASGRFVPTPAYTSIQTYCIKHRDHWASIPELMVSVVGGAPIECSGGIQIIDFSPELGDAGIEIHLNGVTKSALR
jgi:hypothetical protein